MSCLTATYPRRTPSHIRTAGTDGRCARGHLRTPEIAPQNRPNFRSNSTGKERDEETGYSYFSARYLDHTLLTGFLSVDRYADKYPTISPYTYCAWNPLRLIDPSGDTITLSREAWLVQREAFLTVFDRDEKKVPFSYDKTTQRLSFTGETGDYDYSNTQKEIIEHYKSLCESDYNVTVQVVKNDEIIKTSKGYTTLDKDFATGMTVKTGERSANVYISRNPLYEYGGERMRRPFRDCYQSISILHEVGGHAYYNSQRIFGAENNRMTTIFENACRDIFTASYSRGTKEIRRGRASDEH